MSRPSIDHGALSPSGRVSKRSKAASIKRASLALFGPKGLQANESPRRDEYKYLMAKAAELRGLALRGLKPIAYLKKANELECQAGALTAIVCLSKDVTGNIEA